MTVHSSTYNEGLLIFNHVLASVGSLRTPADANGQIQVVPGNRIPGIPRHRGNVVVDYSLTDRWTFGSEAVASNSSSNSNPSSGLSSAMKSVISARSISARRDSRIRTI